MPTEDEKDMMWTADPSTREDYVLTLSKNDKGRTFVSEIALADFVYLTDGMSDSEKKTLAEKYTKAHFRIFLEGVKWAEMRLAPIGRELAREIARLQAGKTLPEYLKAKEKEGAERNRLEKAIRANRHRNGNLNWTKIGKAVSMTDNGAKKKAKRLGLIP